MSSEQTSSDARVDHREPPSPSTGIAGASTWTVTVIVLSALVLVWALAQTAVVVRGTSALYPVTDYPMFSRAGDPMIVEFDLVGTGQAPGAREIVVEGPDLGLTELQLRSHLARHVGSTAGSAEPDADAELEAIASIWESRHGVELTSLALLRSERWLDRDDPPAEEVARWER